MWTPRRYGGGSGGTGERLSPFGEWKGLGSRHAHGLKPGQEVQSLITAFIDESDAEGGMVRLLKFIAEFEHIS